jgi:hypothetical protein
MLCIQKNPKYGDKCGLVSRDIIKIRENSSFILTNHFNFRNMGEVCVF